MKKIVLLSLVVSLIIQSCIQKETTKFPQGAWKNVSFQTIGKDSLGNVATTNYKVDFVKMWSEKNFSFVGQWSQDTIIKDFYGGGTYTLDGNKYSEHVVYHFSQPGMVIDYNLKGLLELRNDTLVQIAPVDDKGKVIEKSHSLEKYVRLK